MAIVRQLAGRLDFFHQTQRLAYLSHNSLGLSIHTDSHHLRIRFVGRLDNPDFIVHVGRIVTLSSDSLHDSVCQIASNFDAHFVLFLRFKPSPLFLKDPRFHQVGSSTLISILICHGFEWTSLAVQDEKDAFNFGVFNQLLSLIHI